jgi:hypothetical protein
MRKQDLERGSWADPAYAKRAWFGPKRFGIGYGPRTWQGYVITAVLVLPVLVTAATAHRHSVPMLLSVIPLIVVPLIIIVVQRRWLGRR